MKFSYSDHFNKYVTPLENWSVLPAKPIVTVIVSTYNHENYIQQCLDGILMQQITFDFEIILKEDCSTDNTREIVKQYHKKFPSKIRLWLTNENLYSKKIKLGGYDYIDSKYIARCEGDDYWTDPLKLQKQVDFLESNPDYILCFHNCDVIYEGDLTYKGTGVRQDLREGEYTGLDLLKKWSIQLATVMQRNQYNLNEIKPKHKDLMNREIHTFLALLEKGKFYCINQKMSVYRRHPGGVTQIPKTLETRVKFLKNYIAKNKVYNYKYDQFLRPKIANFSFNIAKEYLKKKNLLFLKYLIICLKHDPKFLLKYLTKKI